MTIASFHAEGNTPSENDQLRVARLSALPLAHERSFFFFRKKKKRKTHTWETRSNREEQSTQFKKEKANAREAAAVYQKGTRENRHWENGRFSRTCCIYCGAAFWRLKLLLGYSVNSMTRCGQKRYTPHCLCTSTGKSPELHFWITNAVVSKVYFFVYGPIAKQKDTAGIFKVAPHFHQPGAHLLVADDRISFRIIVNSWLFSSPPNAKVGSLTILFAPSCNIVSLGRLANTKVGRVDSLFQVRSIVIICGLCEKRSFSKLETRFKRKCKCWSDGKLSNQDFCRTGNMFSCRLSCWRFLSPEKAAGCISCKKFSCRCNQRRFSNPANTSGWPILKRGLPTICNMSILVRPTNVLVGSDVRKHSYISIEFVVARSLASCTTHRCIVFRQTLCRHLTPSNCRFPFVNFKSLQPQQWNGRGVSPA